MARTLSEIYDALIAEKNSQATLSGLQPAIDDQQTLLNDLTSPSKVAKWRLWLFIVAVAIWIHEMLWDIFKAEVEEIAANAISGTKRWYVEQAFKFQLGDTLLYINGKYQYLDTISPAAVASKIIKRAAVVETGGQVRIKVAKLVANVVTPLSIAELAAFDNYIVQIKFAGTNTATISRVPDLLKVAYQVIYDPLVLAADGSLLSNPAVFPVEDAINNYIGNLPFNGELVLTSLTDAVQKTSGVVNPEIQLAEAKYGAIPYQTIITKYLPDAGYLIIDPAFPLSGQITYVPNV